MARAGSAAAALAQVASMRATLTSAVPSSSRSYSTSPSWFTGFGQKTSTTSTDLVMPGDIFQGAGTAGYTTDGTIAPDQAAMDKAGQQTGFAVPTWLWIAGGVGAAGAIYWFFLRGKRGGSSFAGR